MAFYQPYVRAFAQYTRYNTVYYFYAVFAAEYESSRISGPYLC